MEYRTGNADSPFQFLKGKIIACEECRIGAMEGSFQFLKGKIIVVARYGSHYGFLFQFLKGKIIVNKKS